MLLRENFKHKYYFFSLAWSILIYFAAARIFQDFLYRGFVRPENLFKSLGPLFARPEPYEMPLYLLGMIVIPVLAAFLVPITETIIEKAERAKGQGWWKPLLFAGLALAVLGAVIFFKRVNFDFYLNYLEEKGTGHALWLLLTKRIYVAYLIFAAGVAALPVFYLWNPALLWLKKSAEAGSVKKFEVFFILLLAFLTFHPNFPTQDHHQVYFLGPVNDHLNGKALLYETSHLYGLLDAYFLVLIFKFFLPLSYASLSLITFFFYFGFFVALYYFLKKWLRSPLLGMIGIMILTAVMYFFNTSPTRSVFMFPATTPFRFWIYLPVLFLVLSYSQKPSSAKREISLLLSAIAMFWNLDSGAFIAAALVLSYWYFEQFRLSYALELGLRLLLYLAAIFSVVTLINFNVYHKWPSWMLFFKEIHPFSQGVGMTPLPIAGLFEIFLVVYLSAAMWLLRKQFGKAQPNIVLFFLAVHGIFSLLYYVGESSWQNLTIVSFPAFLVAIYLFRNFVEVRVAKAVFCSVLVYAGLILLVKIPVEFQNRDYSKIKTLELTSDCQDQNLCEDVEELKERYIFLSRIPLLHANDTRILPSIGKPNFFDFYYLFTLYYREDVEKEVERLEREKPQYLFVGHEKDDRIDYFMTLLPQDYQKTGSMRTLDIYERK